MTIKITLLAFILILTSGCAPKMGKLHTMLEKKSATTAQISIIRNYNFAGAGVRLYPTVNNKKVAGLYTKNYIMFYLSQGKYEFGVLFPDLIGGRWIKENTIQKDIEANQHYYFLLSPTVFGMEIEEINNTEGKERISTSTLIQTGILAKQTDPIGKFMMPLGEVFGIGENDKVSDDINVSK